MKTPRNAFGLNLSEDYRPKEAKGFQPGYSAEARAVNAKHELTLAQTAWVRKQKGW